MSDGKSFGERETAGGYLVGEVASALQKCIRRGEERGALFWATELELTGYGGYVWKRLKIIASEDVGLADPTMPILIRTLYENWEEIRKGSKPGYEGFYRVFLLHAVAALARAPKSRALDHALMVMYERPRDHEEIPDFALDVHTKRGRRMGRGARHFVEVASKLENEGPVEDPYKAEGQKKHLKNARGKWYGEDV